MPASKPTRGSLLNKSHPLARGLSGYWPLLAASGKTVFDLSGHINPGIFTGGTDIAWSAGKFGSCLDIGGTDTYVKCNKGFDNATMGTYVFWLFHRSSSASDGFITSKSQNPVIHRSGGSIRVNLGGWHADGFPYDFYIGSVIANKWVMYAVTYDTVRARGYRDGVLRGEYAANPLNPLNVASSNLYMGSDRGLANRVSDVMIDNILVYKRALAASEIVQLYREPFCLIERRVRPYLGLVVTIPGSSTCVIHGWLEAA